MAEGNGIGTDVLVLCYHAVSEDWDADLSVSPAQLESQVQLMLLPKDEADARNAILEVRAGTGGEEAALFAADL